MDVDSYSTSQVYWLFKALHNTCHTHPLPSTGGRDTYEDAAWFWSQMHPNCGGYSFGRNLYPCIIYVISPFKILMIDLKRRFRGSSCMTLILPLANTLDMLPGDSVSHVAAVNDGSKTAVHLLLVRPRHMLPIETCTGNYNILSV